MDNKKWEIVFLIVLILLIAKVFAFAWWEPQGSKQAPAATAVESVP